MEDINIQARGPEDAIRQFGEHLAQVKKTFGADRVALINSYIVAKSIKYGSYEIFLWSSNDSTEVRFTDVNTGLATDTALDFSNYSFYNVDNMMIRGYFTVRGGFINGYESSSSIDYSEGGGTIGGFASRYKLFYSSIQPYDFPNFEGNSNFDSDTRWVRGVIEDAFPLTKRQIKRSFRTCNSKEGYELPESYKNNKFLFFTFKPEALNQPDANGYCITYSGINGSTNSYLRTGEKQWRNYKLNTRGEIPKASLTDKEPDKFIYTNDNSKEFRDELTSISGYPAQNIKYVTHPRKIPTENGGGYQCNGDPWPPDDLDPGQQPGGQTGLPTGHKYYIKAIEGSLETCWTFDGFQSRDGHYNITATNGRCLKYIKDAGCWHFFMSLPAAIELGNKYKLKDIVTNNEEAYNYFNTSGNFEGKIKLNTNKVDISKDFWQNSKALYFASWTALEKSEKPQDQTWYLAVFDFADGTTVRKPDGTTTPIKGHFENGRVYILEAPWTSYQKWKPEGTYKDYVFADKGKSTWYNFQSNHRVLWGWMDRHGYTGGSHSKFISPCTDPRPDGSLPPGVIGPPKPPKPQKPGDGGNDPFGPPAPQPHDPNDPITDDSIKCDKPEDLIGTKANDKLNGLYYYYLEQELFNTRGGKDNTSILGTTEAICNISYVPFYNIVPDKLCRIPFDVKRYGEFEGSPVPNVYRIVSHVPQEMHIASWDVYPKGAKPAIKPGTPWKYTHESRLLDFPYRRCVFYSNVFDAYEVIPHLHHQSSGSLTMQLKTCCATTPGGNFYAYVTGYKGDSGGFIERQFSNASMDIPNTSSAYSNYMSSQKAQASTALQQSALSSLGNAVPTIAPTMLAAAAIPGVNIAMVGAAAMMGAAGSAGTSTLQSMQQNMAYRQDLMTTPKSLKSMGGDVMARLGCAGKATVISCDMVITDMYKDMLARFFQMYGTKQNRVLDVDSNIMSRHYYNYIKTVGCNITSNGVPKRHVATIKAIMDKGTTFWHLDRDGVTYGEYCVYDNCEV